MSNSSSVDLNLESGDNRITNPAYSSTQPSLSELMQARLSRRQWIAASVAAGVGGLTACSTEGESVNGSQAALLTQEDSTVPSFDFAEIAHGVDYDHLCASDHEAHVLIRWGDPLFADAPDFDVAAQSVEAQSQQFGTNCDYVGYLSLTPEAGETARGLLCVNHEYPNARTMFAPLVRGLEDLTPQMTEIAQASVGNSIVCVVQREGQWQVDRTSPYNRRISALDTQIRLSGPAAGHDRLKTAADASGQRVIGTLNNCAGGMTPWGTFLSCEENFNYHFGGELPPDHPETDNHARYNVPENYMGWDQFNARYDIGQTPNEPNRFGWVVEIDPLDPDSPPIKRTALGRFKHEGAETTLSRDGRVVVYMGDDQVFEYLYKFVSRDAVDLTDRSSNRDLLDHGTLYVARLDEDGSLTWLAVDYDDPRLTPHFDSRAEVLIETRRAAQLLGATPMDRPEDVVPNPVTGRVYVMLTNNSRRETPNAPNPRVSNLFGHVIELIEDENDAAALTAKWDMVVQCGNPEDPQHQAQWHPSTSENGWFASPDNAAVDPHGRLWIATDQGSKARLSGTADGLWSLDTHGPRRGRGRMFYRVPKGAELTGPCFSDDGEALFMAIQHPGDYSKTDREKAQSGLIDWPDFTADEPPKSSIVVVTRRGGGRVG